MSYINIKTVKNELYSVLDDYGLSDPRWTCDEAYHQFDRVSGNCTNKKQARVMWLNYLGLYLEEDLTREDQKASSEDQDLLEKYSALEKL